MSEEQQALDRLKGELAEINQKLNQVSALEKRKEELLGSRWANGSKGEIYRAEMALYESKLPIFEKAINNFTRDKRIVAVDSKWISIKVDGNDKKYVYRYKISNGWPERSRDGSGSIDVERALSVWNKHQEGK